MAKANRVAWNKNKKCPQISEALKGKRCSPRTEFKKGDIPWNKGMRYDNIMLNRIFTDNVRKRISDTHKGRPKTDSFKKIVSRNNSARGISTKTKQKISNTLIVRGVFRGSKNPRWKGGSSSCPYASGWNEILKEQIRNKFGNCCVLSLEPENGKRLHVHHINGDKNDHRHENLIPLKTWVHAMIHSNEEFWNGTPYLKIRGAKLNGENKT